MVASVFNLVYFGLESNMVGTCVVYGCTNRQEKGGNISFFHFPHKNPPVLKQWANAVNPLHWFPKDHSLICSVHFKESCFIVRPGKRWIAERWCCTNWISNPFIWSLWHTNSGIPILALLKKHHTLRLHYTFVMPCITLELCWLCLSHWELSFKYKKSYIGQF